MELLVWHRQGHLCVIEREETHWSEGDRQTKEGKELAAREGQLKSDPDRAFRCRPQAASKSGSHIASTLAADQRGGVQVAQSRCAGGGGDT